MDYLEHVATDTERLAAAVERAPGAPVPACPGWTVADIARHVGLVHRRWDEIVRTGATEPVAAPPAPDLDGPALGAWLRSGAEGLTAALRAADPAATVWSWAGGAVAVSWVPRRMALETAVHRWDATSALGEDLTLPADLAADGVDEFVDVFLVHRTDVPLPERVRVHLHRTDGPGEWLVDAGPDGLRVEREHAKGDAAVRADAQDLLLLLWRRLAPDAVEVHGDVAALERFLAWPRL